MLEEKDNAVHFLDNAGQTVLSVKPEVEKKKSQGRQVAAIVRYLSDCCNQPKRGLKSPQDSNSDPWGNTGGPGSTA